MKKLFLMSVMALFCLMTANAQKTVVSEKNQKVYDTVDQLPEFPGGMPALIEYLQTNIKYPKDAEKQKKLNSYQAGGAPWLRSVSFAASARSNS